MLYGIEDSPNNKHVSQHKYLICFGIKECFVLLFLFYVVVHIILFVNFPCVIKSKLYVTCLLLFILFYFTKLLWFNSNFRSKIIKNHKNISNFLSLRFMYKYPLSMCYGTSKLYAKSIINIKVHFNYPTNKGFSCYIRTGN